MNAFNRSAPKTFAIRDFLPTRDRPTPTVPTPPTVRKIVVARRPESRPVSERPASTWRRVRFATSGSVRRIQAWLEAHCQGRWHLGVTGIDRDRATKFGEVHFECAADKKRFKAVFLPGQPAAARLAA